MDDPGLGEIWQDFKNQAFDKEGMVRKGIFSRSRREVFVFLAGKHEKVCWHVECLPCRLLPKSWRSHVFSIEHLCSLTLRVRDSTLSSLPYVLVKRMPSSLIADQTLREAYWNDELKKRHYAFNPCSFHGSSRISFPSMRRNSGESGEFGAGVVQKHHSLLCFWCDCYGTINTF